MKRSQLGQLLDPTGKGVSQQVVVINSIEQRAKEILLAHKQANQDMVQIIQKQAQLMERTSMAGVIDKDIRSEVTDLCDMFMDFAQNVITRMEEACGFIEALPAVIEGDTGIYVKEIMLVAPLLHWENNETMFMKQHVYGPALGQARIKESMNTSLEPARSPDPTTNTQTPFQTVKNTGMDISMINSTNLVEGGDKTYYNNAVEILKRQIRRTRFKGGTVSTNVFKNLVAFTVKYRGVNTHMFEVISTIVSERMSMNGGGNLTNYELEDMMDCLGTGTKEDMSECVEMFRNAVLNRS